MKGINGNKWAEIQLHSTIRNAIGEEVKDWMPVQRIKGFLDLMGGESRYDSFNAKIQESTHIFIADYVKLDARIKAEVCRMVIDGKTYDIKLVDDPMELHEQLEIYLKFTGGQ